MFLGKLPYVDIAKDPSLIIWENLALSTWWSNWFNTLSIAYTLMVIVFNNWFIKAIQDMIRPSYDPLEKCAIEKMETSFLDKASLI